MPNSVRLVIPNYADNAVLTASPAMVATLPVESLQDDGRVITGRSVGLPAPQYIRGEWAEVKTFSSFQLIRHNISGAGTLRFKAWSGSGRTGTLVYDSGVVTLGTIIPYGEYTYGVDVYGATLYQNWPVSLVMLWFASVSALSFELQISDPINTDGFVEASRLSIGPYISPVRNFTFGHKLRWEDESTQERSEGGSLRTDTKEPFRVFRFTLDMLTESERASFSEFLRVVGKTRTLFLAMFPEDGGTKDRDYSALVKIIEMPDLEGDRAYNFRNELVLAEA